MYRKAPKVVFYPLQDGSYEIDLSITSGDTLSIGQAWIKLGTRANRDAISLPSVTGRHIGVPQTVRHGHRF